MSEEDKQREKYLYEKYKLLSEFTIEVTDEIMHHIEKLYPNEIAIENYTHHLISKILFEDNKKSPRIK